MRRAPSQARTNEEMDRLLERLRRLEAHNAQLEDRLRYLPQGPMPYLDRQPYMDRGPYYDHGSYFDRPTWAERNSHTMPHSAHFPSGLSSMPPIQNPPHERFLSSLTPGGNTFPTLPPLRSQGDVGDAVDGAKETPIQTVRKSKATRNEEETTEESDRKATRIKTVWNEDQSKWEDIDSMLEVGTNDAEIPATFRRQLQNDDKVDFEEVEIHSREMKNLLLKTTIHWEDTVTESDESVTITSPFYMFVEHWDEHEQACEPNDKDSEPVRQARVDLKDLMGFIKKSESLKSYFRSRDTIITKRRIKFQFLWTLFGHKTRVYARSYMNQMQMFEVQASPGPGYKENFKVRCTAFDWDGTKFAAFTYVFHIKGYENDLPIDSLDVFPIQYYEDKPTQLSGEQLRQHLIERGRKYVDLCTQHPANFQCQYEGTALVTPTVQHKINTKERNPDAFFDDVVEVHVTPIEILGHQSQVIVDNFSFLQSEQNSMKHNNMPPLGKKIPTTQSLCLCRVCRASVTQQWKPEPMLEPTEAGSRFAADDTQLQLLPPRILGFAPKEKVWGQFIVENVTRTVPKDDKNREGSFWKDLELEKESKELLWAFMQQHKVTATLGSAETHDAQSKSIDVIEGKGQGLVVLLHGPPGVGKTLTAETIALTTGRPLLTVSVAEIGVIAQDAEKSLTSVFADAARWEAVLLMDEADVFVEERTKTDLQRNALVSVLLRCLEYYKGIIILTTNRARTIDAALQSRIQLAIRYKDLTTAQKLRIYQNKLEYLPVEEFEDKAALLAALEYSPLVAKANKANGRQIRNIITYARALAKSEGVKLTIKHLNRVDQVTSDFTESMKEVFTRQRARNEVDYVD
ncbi:hypothetical protein OPT61_g6504 [Boeremia exigua]|uniref:Uncharacterized protein n=1 Tax=Boeremia exigua TaxID=749465 RepID=A0ACC2I6D7_9PLEO|nr:hypothetical protein OPT61_g6504 [Boeremia exigua]